MVDTIWEQYDKDNSGVLNGAEVKKFIDDICNGTELEDKKNEILSYFDQDENGEINKSEVYAFLIGDW